VSKLKELAKKVLEGKATEADLMELAELSGSQAKQAAQEAIRQNVEKVKDFITKQGLSPKAVADAILNEPIFQWGDKVRQSLKGRMPIWAEELKKAMGKAEAMALAVTDEGRKFVEQVYSAPKPKKKAEDKK
jgi:hypothetical protein